MRRLIQGVICGVGVVAAAACSDAVGPAPEAGAPSLATSAAMGRYIVVFRDDVADAPGLASAMARAAGGTMHYTYQHALKGFAASLPEAALAGLRHNPRVAFIEADQPVQAYATQSNATWGIDRIDQRALPLSGTFTYGNSGAGVNAYIIDTGIRFAHAEFGGRAVSGYDAVDGGAADDCNGHGTHVAGTVGGATYGVAKGVRLVGVRVLDCGGSGTTSGVIAGVDWVRANHVKPAVANMSLGGGASTALDNAVKNAIAAGVTFAIAAGNGNYAGIPQSACSTSPARVAEAITVGATDKTDREASFSNYGTCVDLLAPGVGITSSWYTSNSATATISGTSMATPHVAGVAALYLQGTPGASPSAVSSALVAAATKNAVTLHSRSKRYGTPNRLLYTSY
jgi:subtilisin family serine protease